MTARKYQEAFAQALIDANIRQEVRLGANKSTAEDSLTQEQRDWLQLFDRDLLDEFARMVTVLRLESSMNALPLTCRLLPQDFVPNFLFDFEKKVLPIATNSSPTSEHVKRFADYLRGLSKDGKLTDPLLIDVLNYESTHFLTRNAVGDHSTAGEEPVNRFPKTDEQLIQIKPILNDAVKIISFEYDVINAVRSLSIGQLPNPVKKKLTLMFFFSQGKMQVKSISPPVKLILLCCTGQTSIEMIINGITRKNSSTQQGSGSVKDNLISVFRNLFENRVLCLR